MYALCAPPVFDNTGDTMLSMNGIQEHQVMLDEPADPGEGTMFDTLNVENSCPRTST